MSRVLHDGVPQIPGSPLALANVRLEAGESVAIGDSDRDSLLYVFEGNGSLSTATDNALVPGSAALVLAGEQAELQAEPPASVASSRPSAPRPTAMRRSGRARSWRGSTPPRRPRRRAPARFRSSSARTTARRARRSSSASCLPAARRGTTTSTTRSSGSPRDRAGSTSATTSRSWAPAPRSGCGRARCTSSRTRAATASSRSSACSPPRAAPPPLPRAGRRRGVPLRAVVTSLRRPVLLYDSECRVCRFTARLVLRLDRDQRLAFLPLEAEEARPLLEPLPESERMASWRLADPGGSLAGRGSAHGSTASARPPALGPFPRGSAGDDARARLRPRRPQPRPHRRRRSRRSRAAQVSLASGSVAARGDPLAALAPRATPRRFPGGSLPRSPRRRARSRRSTRTGSTG